MAPDNTVQRLAHPWLLHLLVWGALLSVPIYMAWENPAVFHFAKRSGIMLLALAVIFYVNYLWAIDHLFYRKRYALFLLCNVSLFVLVGLMQDGLRELLSGWAPEVPELSQRPRPPKHSNDFRALLVYNNAIFYCLAVVGSLGVRYIVLSSSIEMARKRLENETLTSELSLLKYQLQPHFFFNSLNNIYALVDVAPDKAKQSVYALSKMMRYILYDCSNSTIPLCHEVEFLNNYVALMRLRLCERALVKLTFPDTVGESHLPPLMLIPLLENAFKHGVGPAGEADIAATLRLGGGRLHFEVANRVYGGPTDDRSQSGVGLSNLRKRLAIIYGADYSFTAAPRGETFLASLDVPLEDNAKQNE